MTRICQKREEIIATAKKLFNQLGYENTSMRKIAEAVGSAKASLYYYFKSKEEIFISIIEHEGEEYFRKYNIDLETSENHLSELHDFLMLPAVFFRRHSEFMIKQFFNPQKIMHMKSRSRIIEMKTIFFNIFKELLEKGKKSGEILADLEVERFIQIILVNIHSMLFTFLPEDMQPVDADGRIRNYELMLNIMIEGIKRK